MTEASRELPGIFNDYRLGSVGIEGDQATVELTAPGSPDELRLENVGEWKISDAPGPGTSALLTRSRDGPPGVAVALSPDWGPKAIEDVWS